MSSDNQYSLSATKTSNSNNYYLTQICQDDIETDLSLNATSSGIVELCNVKQQYQSYDCAALIDKSKILQTSIAAAKSDETKYAISQQPKVQPQQVIHYPAEFMQLGKRKFQSFESSQSEDKSQPPSTNFTFANTASQNNQNGLDNEAGLSLLFAASLLQQQQQNNRVSNIVADITHTAGTIPLTNAKDGLNWGREHQQQVAFQPCNSTSNMEASIIDHAIYGNMEDGNSIEPRANDVLCGRGGGINKHYGNIIYRRVVEYNKRVYKQVPKRHRMLVSRSIVQAIINAGGRFLQQEVENGASNSPSSSNNQTKSGCMDDPKLTKQCRWTPIQIRRAVQKTSQALRERSCSSNNSNDDEGDDDPESVSVMN